MVRDWTEDTELKVKTTSSKHIQAFTWILLFPTQNKKYEREKNKIFKKKARMETENSVKITAHWHSFLNITVKLTKSMKNTN